MLQDFRGAKYTRQAGAGVSGSADEVEALDVAFVMKSPIRALAERRLDREPRSMERVEIVAEMLGGDVELFDDVLAQLGEEHELQIIDDQIAILWAGHFPVDLALEVGHGAEHVKRIAARGRHGGIGGGGAVEIKG